MPSYAWSCLACAASNAPTQARCVQCGCPASADQTQVDAARRAAHNAENTRPRIDLVETLQSFGVLWIAAGVLALCGVMALLLGGSASFTAFGGLLLALAALCVSSYRSPRPASV